jgi:Zn-finger nucleic acid-binding protein
MKCPVCPEMQLVMSDRSGIEIDYCPQCRGVWLDRGELDKIIERSAAAAPQAESPRESFPATQQTLPQHAAPMTQPYGFAPPRREHDDDDYRRDDRYRDSERYRGDDYKKKKKRGGFLEDLFDFD